LEAESVAYIVCGALGIDSGQSSWGYLASWGADASTVRQAGQCIQETAECILQALEVAEESAA
jgi:ABC-type sulfate transport system substrate-binding protein